MIVDNINIYLNFIYLNYMVLFTFPMIILPPLSTIIYSLTLGLMTGYLIIQLVNHPILHGPDSNIVLQQIYYDSNQQQCYRYVPRPNLCPLAKLTKR